MRLAQFVWNPNIAYAVGLIATDGSLSKDGRHISFTSKDYNLLLVFNYCINKICNITINPISRLSKQIVYRVQISDIDLYHWLNTVGLKCNKSLSISELQIPDKYFCDFLRGHLDGDGSIIHYTDRYLAKKNPLYVYDRLFVYFLSASELHIKWIQQTIHRLYHVKGSLHAERSRTQIGKHSMYKLIFSTKEAKILLKLLYWDYSVPCLNRKYKIAENYLENK
jgi:hypothetical protein